MKISMRTDYGTRAVIDLAQHYGEGPIQSAEIAARQSIPEAYLEQLLTTLRRAGFVRSVRGPHGGHELARQPKDVTFGAIVEALEGPSAPLECLEEPSTCQVAARCAVRDVWAEVQDATKNILFSVTIQDLVERQAAREQRVMYYI
jgi:Rrf2 family protein